MSVYSKRKAQLKAKAEEKPKRRKKKNLDEDELKKIDGLLQEAGYNTDWSGGEDAH